MFVLHCSYLIKRQGRLPIFLFVYKVIYTDVNKLISLSINITYKARSPRMRPLSRDLSRQNISSEREVGENGTVKEPGPDMY